jgi:hypothetical protein
VPCGDRRRELEGAYRGYLTRLFGEARALYRGERAEPGLARLPRRLGFDDVVDLFELLGHQRFRIRNTFYEQKHKTAKQTMDYALEGRHLGFCCDRW